MIFSRYSRLMDMALRARRTLLTAFPLHSSDGGVVAFTVAVTAVLAPKSSNDEARRRSSLETGGGNGRRAEENNLELRFDTAFG